MTGFMQPWLRWPQAGQAQAGHSTTKLSHWFDKARGGSDAASTCAGLAAVSLMSVLAITDTIATASEMAASPVSSIAAAARNNRERASGRSSPEWTFGGYGGIAHTLPTVVEIKKPGQTDLKVKDFGWIGRPFKAPIYYGLRTQRWASLAPVGGMIDFTHAKAIAKRDDIGSFSGTLDGKPVKPKTRMGDFFRHLEFSHGHNILTLNGLLRLAPWWARMRPYVGVGAGVSLPHTEVGIRSQNKTRTYEYQFAGFAGQALVGLEIQLGRSAIFIEYKFTYAPYDVPLSHEPRGWLLVTDLWRQATAWWKGEKPPGGRLRATLITHHGIAGVLVKNRPYMERVTK